MTTHARKTIYLENAYLVRQELRYYDPEANNFVVWSSQPAAVSFSTDRDGVNVISGLGNLLMSESGAAPGNYYLTLSNSQVDNLLPYVGQIVYQHTVAGFASELRVTVPLLVAQPRYI